jgi:hypothetical protein
VKLFLAAPVLLFVVFVPFLAGGPNSDGAGTSPSPTPTGTRIATFTLTIYYNPAMAPGWFTEEMVKDYMVAWNGITPGVNVFYGGETTATVQCGVQTDASAHASVIAWQRLP